MSSAVVDYRWEEEEGHGNSGRVMLGDLVSGQELELVLRLNFPRGEIGHRMVATFSLTDLDGVMDGPPQSLSWEYADHAANEAQPRERTVDRQVAAVHAAQARQEAVLLNRSGDFQAASDAIRKVADMIGDYAGDDAELKRMVMELQSEKQDFAVLMAPMELKQRHFASSTVAMARDALGKARRRPQA